jgi:hypothetical protein
MHDGPELDERRREDHGCAAEANTAVVPAPPPVAVDDAPAASAITGVALGELREHRGCGLRRRWRQHGRRG